LSCANWVRNGDGRLGSLANAPATAPAIFHLPALHQLCRQRCRFTSKGFSNTALTDATTTNAARKSPRARSDMLSILLRTNSQ
jgi:hypothetical protein